VAGEVVLVVDDNPMNLKLIRFLLRRLGYDVREASDADQALAILNDVLPAVILMDIQLPGMDGLELTRRLKGDDRTRAIPIVALTAFAMAGDDERAFAAGCDGYVTKPIDTRALPAIIERFVSRP
jgi:CheY-like chemotaxis protein